MHLWSFHVSSNIPMECGWSSDIGYNIVFVWCSLSFDISIRAEVSTFWQGTSNHWWDVPGNEYCTQIYELWICHNLLGTYVLTQSYNQIKTSSDPKEQSQISTLPRLSGAEKTRLRFTRCFSRSWHRLTLTLNNQKKWVVMMKRNQSKKKRLGAKSSNWMWWKHPMFGIGKDIQESEQVFCWTTNFLSKLILLEINSTTHLEIEIVSSPPLRSLRGPISMTSPWPGGANRATDLRKAIPWSPALQRTPKIPIR